MRYVLVDRIVSLAPGVRLRAFKCVTATDGAAVSDGAGMPHLPGTMLLEAMAQTAGLLVVASTACASQPVLAKVQAFAMMRAPVAGDRIELHAVLEDMRAEGARLRVEAVVDDENIASADIFLGLLPIVRPEDRVLLGGRLAALFPDWFARSFQEAQS